MKKSRLLIEECEQSKEEEECIACNNPYYLDYVGLFVNNTSLSYDQKQNELIWVDNNRQYRNS